MATADILSYLKPEHDSFNDLSDKHYFKMATREISIAPRWWDEYFSTLNTINFKWKSVKYSELNKHLRDDKSNGNGIGVYLFVVQPSFQLISLPGYVFYVGIAGEGDSGRHLRERLRQYIQKSGIEKRNKVQAALELYHTHTHIYYSKLNVTSKELEKIEKNLHAYYLPWANDRDFPTKIKQAKKAFGL
jgi:hypothetical protein